MAKTRNYMDYLDENIQIAPANSQEEYQAAETIAEILRDHELETNIEEFDAHPMAKMLPAILTIVLFVCLLVAGLTEGTIHFVMVILALAAVGVPLYIHFSGMNLFENVGPASRSQNVVAVHRATGSKVVKGARPIVVVAHYDTPRESLLSKGPLARNRALLATISIPCTIAVAVSVLFQLMVFLPGVLRTITWVIGLIALVPLLIVAIATIYDRFAPCTEGANNNKSSVAALLSIANAVRPGNDRVDGMEQERAQRPARRRVGDEPEPEPEPRRVEVLEEVNGVRHGVEVLGSLGILPPSCEIVYKEPRIQVVEEEPEVPALGAASPEAADEYDDRDAEAYDEDVPAEGDRKEGDTELSEDEIASEWSAANEDQQYDEAGANEDAQEEDDVQDETTDESLEDQPESAEQKTTGDDDVQDENETEDEVEPAATTNTKLSRSLPSFLENEESKTSESDDYDDNYDDEYDDNYDDEYDDEYDDYDGEYEDEYEYDDEYDDEYEGEYEDEDAEPDDEGARRTGVGAWISERVASVREYFSKNRGSDINIEPGEDRRDAEDQESEEWEEDYEEYDDNESYDQEYDEEHEQYDEDDRYDEQYDEDDRYNEDEYEYEDDRNVEVDRRDEVEQVEDQSADEADHEDEYVNEPSEDVKQESADVADVQEAEEAPVEDGKEQEQAADNDNTSGVVAAAAGAAGAAVGAVAAAGAAAVAAGASVAGAASQVKADNIPSVEQKDQAEPEYEYSDYEYDEDEFEDEDNYDVETYDDQAYDDEYEEEYVEEGEGEEVYEESYDEESNEEHYEEGEEEAEEYEGDAEQSYEDADAYVPRKKTVGGRIARFFQKIRINEEDVRAANEAKNELTPESGYTELREDYDEYGDYDEYEDYEEDQEYEESQQYEDDDQYQYQSNEVYEDVYNEEDFYEEEGPDVAASQPEGNAPQEEVYDQGDVRRAEQGNEPEPQGYYVESQEQARQMPEPEVQHQQYRRDDYVEGQFADVDLTFDDEVEVKDTAVQSPEEEKEPLVDPNILHFDREEDSDLPPKDDTGLSMISESYDLFQGDVPRAAEYQRPIPVEDPNWGVTSYQPARPAMSIARRAALFDLPDPSLRSIDPFDNEYEDYDDEYDEATAQDSSTQHAEPEPAPAPEPEPISEPVPEPAPKPEPEQTSQPEQQADETKADEPVRDPSSTGSFWSKPNGGQSDWKGGATTRADLAEGDEPIYIDAEDLQDAILEMGDEFLVAHDIWFVATGASEVDHAGMLAFIDAHRRDIRGAFLVNMDCIGSGALSLLVREGLSSPRRADRRLVRMITGIAQDLHIQLDTAICNWGEHDSATAMRSRVRSVTITGLDENNLPAFSHTPDDIPDNVDPRQVSDVVRIVTELIRRS